jgi:glutamine---fructose-6-phosphate transaminase (isomerizing)
MFIASEASAFSKYTNSFIVIKDDEVATITSQGHSLTEKTIEQSETERVITTPFPYPFWTLREIFEQPEAISRSLAFGGRFSGDDSVKLGGLESNQMTLRNSKHLIIIGCGTSFYSALFASRIFRLLSSFETVRVVDASELSKIDFPKSGGLLLALSQSGETKDVHRAVVLATEENLPCFSIVNTVRSLIARETNCGVYMHAGRENGVASTKSFTCQVVCLALVSIWFSQLNPGLFFFFFFLFFFLFSFFFFLFSFFFFLFSFFFFLFFSFLFFSFLFFSLFFSFLFFSFLFFSFLAFILLLPSFHTKQKEPKRKEKN